MDGETALKFVRSRNAQGDEGTDTAREARQQKIITAVKDKILSPSTFLSAKKLISLWKMAKNLLETDIPGPSGVVIARKLFWGRNNLTTEVLPTEFLENPPISPRYDNQYVFIPAEGDWSKVKEWVRKKI
jgi:anionic cell wall polymer biosynthesis LytR-Cps2A-Psr (LCP) family protein